MRTDQTSQIVWSLRALGQIQSSLHNDGNGLVFNVWFIGGFDSNDKPIVAAGDSMDSAVQSLWTLLTASGSYVIVGNRKHVFNRGLWQQIIE